MISLKIRRRLGNPSGPSRNIRHNRRVKIIMIKNIKKILNIFINIMMKLNNRTNRDRRGRYKIKKNK